MVDEVERSNLKTFEVIHRPGTQNGAADALSQCSYPLSIEQWPASLPVAPVESPCSSSFNLHTLQREDTDLFTIITYLETSTLPVNDAKA